MSCLSEKHLLTSAKQHAIKTQIQNTVGQGEPILTQGKDRTEGDERWQTFFEIMYITKNHKPPS